MPHLKACLPRPRRSVARLHMTALVAAVTAVGALAAAGPATAQPVGGARVSTGRACDSRGARPATPTWTVSTLPGIGEEYGFGAVASLSACAAWAVGGALLEYWNGHRWARVPSPGFMSTISATSADNIWGVGGTSAMHCC